MDIYINNEKIDFKLESETLLHQVVEEIKTWLEKDGFHIKNIYFDGVLYDNKTESCRNTELTSVSSLNVAALSNLDIHQENLQLLYQYINLFIKSIEGGNLELVKELQKESAAISGLLGNFLKEKDSEEDTISKRLHDNIMNLLDEDSGINSETEKNLMHQLQGLKIILTERISELSNPLSELSKTLTAMKTSVEEINDISVLLQTGKDREALNSIIRFSELSQKMLRIYPVLKGTGIVNFDNVFIDDMSFSDYYNDLNNILSELIEAFTANDSVLIGDLLEYEIAPRINSLIETLDSISRSAGDD